MDTVYLLAAEFFIILLSFQFLSKIYALLISIIIISGLGIALRKREFFYWVIPLLLIFRILSATTDVKLEKGDSFEGIASIYEGRGRIEKIFGKIPYRSDYISLDRMEDGKYLLRGKVERMIDKKYYTEYRLKEITWERLEAGILQKRFLRRAERVSGNSRNEERNLFTAVILGIKEPLYPRIRNLFIESGAAHILAISGLHLGLVAGILDLILRQMRLPKRERSLFLLLGITLYFFGIRISPSVQRAYIMVFIAIMGRVFYENSEGMKSLALAFIFSTIMDPTSYRDMSAVLSYSAMFIIFIVSPKLSMMNSKIRESWKGGENLGGKGVLAIGNYLIFTLIIQLGMAPIVYLYSGKYSLKAIFISLIVTPIGMIYIILCFLSLIFPVMPLTNICYNLMIGVMEFLQ